MAITKKTTTKKTTAKPATKKTTAKPAAKKTTATKTTATKTTTAKSSSTETSMDMARKAELRAFSSSFMNNYSLTDDYEAFMDKESDFTKQVHDGFLGMSLRAWWEELKK